MIPRFRPLNGKRQRVLKLERLPATPGKFWLRLILTCKHVVYRNDEGAHPIWIVCEKCA